MATIYLRLAAASFRGCRPRRPATATLTHLGKCVVHRTCTSFQRRKTASSSWAGVRAGLDYT